MAGLMSGLEIGKRALLTHQLTMTIIGHNMANVGTPGYTRQRVSISAGFPLENANYIIGTGVRADNITHIRDLFLTNQYRRENTSLGQWTYKEKATRQIEIFLAEPGNNSLGTAMDGFWNSWSELSNPDNVDDLGAARPNVISQTRTMINGFHSLDRQLRNMQAAADADVVGRVNQINGFSREIANLNKLIVGEELNGQSANDLRDHRDYLVDQLSNLVDVTTREKANGSLGVYVSGLSIVENSDSFDLSTIVDSSGKMTKRDIVWKGTNTKIKITGGELKGLLDTRDITIVKYLDKLDDMAAALVTEVNAIHRLGTGLNGSTGLNFFNESYKTAATIKIDAAIENNPGLIAASLSGAPGDNANALSLYDLRNSTVMSFGTTTISEFYNSMVGSIGVEAFEAKTFKGNFEVMLQQIENSRQSVQGVSLDEEMANMIKMQHAYNAAARLVTFMDEALGTVIQGMGVSGR